MTDDAFHLTPLDVRRFEFPAALRGYDRTRVDAFRDQVADELERLTKQIQELDGKAKSFHEQLRSFRDRDKALNDALVSAQQLRGQMREQAEKEAELVIREAKSEAGKIVEEANREARRIADEIETLRRSRRAYLAQIKSLTERQLAEIEAAAGMRVTPMDQPAIPAEQTSSNPTPAWLKSLVEEE